MIPPIVAYLLARLATEPRPRTVACERGFYLNGVRPSGETECIQVSPVTPGDECGRGETCSGDWPDMPSYPVRVWCDEGEMAVVVDERTARCMRGSRV